jgi:hypothetical protein
MSYKFPSEAKFLEDDADLGDYTDYRNYIKPFLKSYRDKSCVLSLYNWQSTDA